MSHKTLGSKISRFHFPLQGGDPRSHQTYINNEHGWKGRKTSIKANRNMGSGIFEIKIIWLASSIDPSSCPHVEFILTTYLRPPRELIFLAQFSASSNFTKVYFAKLANWRFSQSWTENGGVPPPRKPASVTYFILNNLRSSFISINDQSGDFYKRKGKTHSKGEGKIQLCECQ